MFGLKNVLVEKDRFPHGNRQKEYHESTGYQEGFGGNSSGVGTGIGVSSGDDCHNGGDG